MRLRLLLLMGILSFFLVNTIQAAQKSVDDETVEGSANVDNPDDEDFEETSGLPPDDEDNNKEPARPIIKNDHVHQKPTPEPPLYPTTVILNPGTASNQWSLDTSTIVILLGAFILVVLLIALAVICLRKRSRKSEYTRGTRQQYV